MKNLYKLLGIAAIGAVISLGLAACPSDPGPGPSTTYTVTYNGNGSTDGVVPSDSNSPYESGATVMVLTIPAIWKNPAIPLTGGIPGPTGAEPAMRQTLYSLLPMTLPSTPSGRLQATR
jgi:hypothetical protein